MSLARRLIEDDVPILKGSEGTAVRHPQAGMTDGGGDAIDSDEGGIPDMAAPDLKATEPGWVPAARWVVANGAAKVDPTTLALVKRGGIILDAFTANMLTKVYDAITRPETKEKFAKLSLQKAASIGWKYVK